jgi:hypothetical protein
VAFEGDFGFNGSLGTRFRRVALINATLDMSRCLFQFGMASQFTRPDQPTGLNPTSREQPSVTARGSLNQPDTVFHPEGAIADQLCPSNRIARRAPRHLTNACTGLASLAGEA